jgi:hypothetical protein
MSLTSAELTKAVGTFKLYKTLIAIGIVSIIVLCVCILFLRQKDRLLSFGCIGFAVACLVLITMTKNPNPDPALTKETLAALSNRVCDTNRELLVKEIPVKEDDPKVAKKWVGFIEGCNGSSVMITQFKNAADAKYDDESVVNVLGKDGMFAIEPQIGVGNSNLKMIDGIPHVRSMQGRAIPLAQFTDTTIDYPVAMAAVGSVLARI